MNKKEQYRLTKVQKHSVAQNLIDILQKDTHITDQTSDFVYRWITTGADGKTKAFFDVWDIVLKNYLPTTRPILFRSCDRISKRERIASFTARFQCIKKFSKGRGCLIICDTEEALELDESLYKPGKYRHTFYPLVEVLLKAKKAGWADFSENFLDRYIGEDEYIMRIHWGSMDSFKWVVS